jgi:hypothetical protein
MNYLTSSIFHINEFVDDWNNHPEYDPHQLIDTLCLSPEINFEDGICRIICSTALSKNSYNVVSLFGKYTHLWERTCKMCPELDDLLKMWVSVNPGRMLSYFEQYMFVTGKDARIMYSLCLNGYIHFENAVFQNSKQINDDKHVLYEQLNSTNIEFLRRLQEMENQEYVNKFLVFTFNYLSDEDRILFCDDLDSSFYDDLEVNDMSIFQYEHERHVRPDKTTYVTYDKYINKDKRFMKTVKSIVQGLDVFIEPIKPQKTDMSLKMYIEQKNDINRHVLLLKKYINVLQTMTRELMIGSSSVIYKFFVDEKQSHEKQLKSKKKDIIDFIQSVIQTSYDSLIDLKTISNKRDVHFLKWWVEEKKTFV